MAKYIGADALVKEIKDIDAIINYETESAKGRHKAYAEIIAAINRMPTADVEPVRKWIPCCERLPEKFEECIVVKADSKVTTGAYYSRKTQKWMRDCWGRWAEMLDVVAWMPLPEPPKMKGGKKDD